MFVKLFLTEGGVTPHQSICDNNKMSLVTRKPVFGIFDQVRRKPAFTATEAS